MPFDPTLPANNSALSSLVMRNQLTGLKTLIDGVSGVTSAQVDAVNTVDPGVPAAASVSVVGTVLHLSFDIPRGDDGPPGEVTQAALESAIAGTSNNTNAVSTLDNPYGDPDAEELRQKMNELILTARR